MANPTSNFGWQMPTPTDLVTDLPADFEVFGQAVDTSMADLKGGTTDQVLAKNSNTDMDFKWVTSDDANAIQNAIVDAKGDLITATAADTPARLAVGTNDYFLQAASGEATGLKWGGAQGTYAPTITGFTVGNGSVSGAQWRVGGLVFFHVTVTFGSTSAITGAISFPAPTGVNRNFIGINASIDDFGVGIRPAGASIYGSTVYVDAINASGTYATNSSFSSTVPFTWATNDGFSVSGFYGV
jgi:hypothetical protein